jgi:hypothetical protein
MSIARLDSMIDHSLFGVTSSTDTADLTAALAAAQSEFPAISKTGENKFGKYHYLTYAGICEGLVGPLTKHGLTLPQIGLTQRSGEWFAVGILRHKTGQWITSMCPLYLGKEKDGTPKADMQSLGSAYTYAKKYLLLGLVGGWAEEDDDGQKTMPSQAEPSRGKDRSLEIEQAAKHEIDRAKSDKEVAKVLSLVKLRVSEKVAHPDVLKRVISYKDSKKEVANGQPE